MKKSFLLIVTIFLTFFLIGCESSFHKHEYNKEFIYPTCTEKGYIVYSCKCGDEYNDNYVDELGHTCNDWEIIEESTAITQGIKQGICSRCKESFQEKLPLNNAPNLQGYTIKISLPWILENLFSVGKIFKKDSPYLGVLDEVEKKYNCKFELSLFYNDVWGGSESTFERYIMSCSESKKTDYDIYGIPDDLVPTIALLDGFVDLTEYYNKYGNNMMNDLYIKTGSFKNKLYTVSNNDISLPHVINYNIPLYEKLKEVDSTLVEPAKIFNDNNWTFEAFKQYCVQIQNAMAKLYNEEGTAGNENQKYYAVSGWDSYWWAGLASNVNEPIVDMENKKVNLNTELKKEAADIVKYLLDNNLFDPRQNVDNGVNSWVEGRSFFCVGDFYLISKENKWPRDMWGEDTRYGYVPWPSLYDDKKDASIAVSGDNYTYAMAKYRDYSGYGEDCNSENIYIAFIELLQKYQERKKELENNDLQYVNKYYYDSNDSTIAYTYVKSLIEKGNYYYDPLCHYNSPIGSIHVNNVERKTIKGAVNQYCATNKVNTWDEAIENVIVVLQESLNRYFDNEKA